MGSDGLNPDAILVTFVDHLMPFLRPYETTIYLYLLRRTTLRGQVTVKVGLRTISRDCGVGTRSPSGGNIQHIREVLDALEVKGCIKIGERTREGTVIAVYPPLEVQAVRERIVAASAPASPLDYYRDPELRTHLFERDGWTCHYCGDAVTTESATLDHLVPVSMGGMNTAENLVAACFLCNSVKSGKTYEQAAAPLLDSIRARRLKRSLSN